jgi:voltage-gated potassium channel
MDGQRRVEQVLSRADPWLKLLIAVGIGVYLAELCTLGGDRLAFFRWAEVVIAVLFTAEYVLRWYDDATDHYGWHYPQSPLGVVDLIAILPFWVGLFAPPDWHAFLRTFRIFQLLKFFRYSRSLQLIALGFYRAGHHLRALGFAMLVVALFCTVAVFEAERDAQPDKLRNLFDAAYFTFVTVATIGYGDISPVTVAGRVIVMVSFLFALAIFAGMLGVVGGSFMKVLEEEADPAIDPIDAFRRERERYLRQKAARGLGPSDPHLPSDGGGAGTGGGEKQQGAAPG